MKNFFCLLRKCLKIGAYNVVYLLRCILNLSNLQPIRNRSVYPYFEAGLNHFITHFTEKNYTNRYQGRVLTDYITIQYQYTGYHKVGIIWV